MVRNVGPDFHYNILMGVAGIAPGAITGACCLAATFTFGPFRDPRIINRPLKTRLIETSIAMLSASALSYLTTSITSHIFSSILPTTFSLTFILCATATPLTIGLSEINRIIRSSP